ncbi:MAG: 16S rRNA (cytidine(1402)-2'-O)-methyltransferase [Alphaproteobacteria bacterium]
MTTADSENEPRSVHPSAAPAIGPGLTLVATPIGNMGDLSPRALAALKAADAVLCEDSRTTGAMLARLGIAARLIPLHDHNEANELPRILAMLQHGKKLALVSDAGTPLVSDPGFRLVRAAIAEALPISAIPGPNAAVMALILSGLPPEPFLFQGFLPPREAARAAALGRLKALELAGLAASMIFYEAPHRLGESLADMAAGFGAERPAAVAREMTKRFEEVRRGSLGDLAAHYASAEARGEICIMVGPAAAEAVVGDAEVTAQLRAALAGGLSVKDAAEAVAKATGRKRRDVYREALALLNSA